MNLTTDRHIDLSMNLMFDFLLYGYTAEVVSFGHSSLKSDVEVTFSFRDMRFFSRNDGSSFVPPFYVWFWSAMDFTLQQCPIF